LKQSSEEQMNNYLHNLEEEEMKSNFESDSELELTDDEAYE
jgi:hypothetical protein